VTELLKQAALLLAREATRLPSHALDARARGPSAEPAAAAGPSEVELRRQAYALIGSLLNWVGEGAGNRAPRVDTEFPNLAPRGAAPAVRGSTGAAAPPEEQVPLVYCDAVVSAGGTALARVRISNQSDSACSAALYCTNFVTDTGYEIPSVRVSVSPRQVLLPARAAADFEISIAVPEQTPAGSYSGLIRALGSRDFRVVLSVEVS
jgi:hypothetical protein